MALGITTAVAVAMFWLFTNANEARAVAEAANESYAVQIAAQQVANDEAMLKAEQERQSYQAASRLAAQRREELRLEIEESRSLVEKTRALLTESQIVCAAEPTPAAYVGVVRDRAAARSNPD